MLLKCMLCQKLIGLIKERADLAWSSLMLYIRVCELLYVCSAVYETSAYDAMRGAVGEFPRLLYFVLESETICVSLLISLSLG